jgi:hypothetical protein
MAPCRCPVLVNPKAAAISSPALDHGPLLSKPCGPRRGEPEVNAGLRRAPGWQGRLSGHVAARRDRPAEALRGEGESNSDVIIHVAGADIGTLASRFSPLVLLPCHQWAGSCSSAQKPMSDSRPLYAGRRPPSHQAPGGLVPEEIHAPGFDDACFLTTRLRRVHCHSSFGHSPAQSLALSFWSNAHHHAFWTQQLGVV